MYRAASLAAAVILCMASLPTLADPLPKTAKPMNSDEITKLSNLGKTTDWKISSAYFAPDGTVKKGYLGKPVVKTTFKGTWKVTGNEICMEFSTPKDSGLSDCWKYWRNGKDVITLWSSALRRLEGRRGQWLLQERGRKAEGRRPRIRQVRRGRRHLIALRRSASFQQEP